eukprot:CAMPEP_0115655180 /NCGR_PEP_ID=MMETSP0272-20121206/43497_1 /TAXON_ID=71861 /ORGANISM="Scrippsiella trochoidea, Strain CCMP3099" /LENGTH=39 /DNA_ID= /DNA_START= /DNA_END= /DNA_ORIENTATION=
MVATDVARAAVRLPAHRISVHWGGQSRSQAPQLKGVLGA